MSKTCRLMAAAAISSLLLAGTAQAADWPDGNITMIVPFGAGGSIDRFARGLAQHWEENLEGTSIIVENRPGASGLLGAKTFLAAEPDGQTLFVGIQPTLSMNIVAQGADFSLDDFAFINFEQRDYGDVVVRAESPYQSIEEVVEDARARPGEISVAMIQGGGTTLFGLALIDALGLDVRQVTFNSGGELRTNMLGGHSDVTISGAYGDTSLGDQVRVLTVASKEPFPGWPDTPPITSVYPDANVPELGDNRFVAVHAELKEQHPEVFEKIVESYKATFESAMYQAFLKETGSDMISGYIGPEKSHEISGELHAVVERFQDVLKGQ